MQKNKQFCCIIISMALYCLSIVSMEMPPTQQSINNYNNLPISPSPFFPPMPQNNKPILGFEIKDLAQLAPIAISMYCFNEFPRFTMIGLSIMLIYTITAKEIFKKNEQDIIHKFKKFCKKIYRLFITSSE
jgi:hypothetical protein